MIHYILIIIVIAYVLYKQVTTFTSTKKKLSLFKNIFTENSSQISLDTFASGEPCIISKHDNEIWKTIEENINNYLHNNKGAVSDYHILKDIIDRNTDSLEDEIETQVPVPLYFGLVGTMAGILIGIASLLWSGGLSNLLSSTSNKGAEGVEALLTGVALAMISSIVGIYLTTSGSSLAKEYKVVVEKNKNIFLSWIQANLLPKLSDGAAGTLEKVSHNLNKFNTIFSQNTKDLRETFSFVRETYKDLSSVLDAINHLKINNIAKYNIQVFEHMKNYIDEIAILGNNLKGVNQYLLATSNVVEKLDKVFEKEINQFDTRIGILKKAVGNIDQGIEKSLTILADNNTTHMDEFIKSAVQLNSKFEKAIEEQQNTLENAVEKQQENFGNELIKQEEAINLFIEKQSTALATKSKEVELLVAELQNLSAVKSGITKLEQYTREQNNKIDRLAMAIEKLAQLKLEETGEIGKPLNYTPKWMKVSGVIIGIVISSTCIFYIITTVLNMTGIYR